MPLSSEMTVGLRCVRCQTAALDWRADGLRCVRCETRYPFIGGIPCLMPDPELWRSVWQARLTEFLSDTETSLRTWRVEAAASDPMPRTRARIDQVIAGCEEQRARVGALLSDLAQGDRQLLPTRPESGDNPVLAFSENLFRDWAWGDKEAEVSRVLVARLIDEPVGRLAVYGAGAGRLAVDVHRSLRPTETWALDMNPLPLLVAEKLIHGESVTLPEFPVAPHGEDGVVITRQLRCPFEVGPGFAFIFADGLRPPFAPGSLDVVLTSWFIDATGRDVRQTAAAINHALRPGGLWVNVGPLRFKQSLATNYSIQEIWDIVAANAFDLGRRERDDISYFDSPVSGSRRIETVFSFVARKAAEAKVFVSPESVPGWIADPSIPIPLTPELTALGRKSMFAGSVIGLIDGNRSMSAVADEMGRLWGFDAARIREQLRAFFATLPLG